NISWRTAAVACDRDSRRGTALALAGTSAAFDFALFVVAGDPPFPQPLNRIWTTSSSGKARVDFMARPSKRLQVLTLTRCRPHGSPGPKATAGAGRASNRFWRQESHDESDFERKSFLTSCNRKVTYYVTKWLRLNERTKSRSSGPSRTQRAGRFWGCSAGAADPLATSLLISEPAVRQSRGICGCFARRGS